MGLLNFIQTLPSIKYGLTFINVASYRIFLFRVSAVLTLYFNNETNVVLKEVGTFYLQISAFKCNFGPICGL